MLRTLDQGGAYDDASRKPLLVQFGIGKFDVTGIGILGPFLPLLAVAALVITSVRRRREKKKRFEERNGRA